MRIARAYRFVAVVALSALGGCVALSGLGDLNTGDDAVTPDGALVGTDGNPVGTDGHTIDPFDGGFDFDTGFPFPFDGSFVFDGNQPDTGGPDSGPAGTGITACTASLQCTADKPVCCFSPFFPFPSCTKTQGACPTGMGFECDDNTDCPKLCCLTWSGLEGTGSSKCMDTCPTQGSPATGKQGAACTPAEPCQGGDTCGNVPTAPAQFKACQQ